MTSYVRFLFTQTQLACLLSEICFLLSKATKKTSPLCSRNFPLSYFSHTISHHLICHTCLPLLGFLDIAGDMLTNSLELTAGIKGYLPGSDIVSSLTEDILIYSYVSFSTFLPLKYRNAAF